MWHTKMPQVASCKLSTFKQNWRAAAGLLGKRHGISRRGETSGLDLAFGNSTFPELSEFFWLVDRDPYVMAYEIIPKNMKNNWVVLYIIPQKKKKTNQPGCFHCSNGLDCLSIRVLIEMVVWGHASFRQGNGKAILRV